MSERSESHVRVFEFLETTEIRHVISLAHSPDFNGLWEYPPGNNPPQSLDDLRTAMVELWVEMDEIKL